MTYQAINRICIQSDSAFSAAEAHGIATGMLCVNRHASSDQWLSELFGDAFPVIQEEKRMLEQLFKKTSQLLANEQFTFELFLPDDDHSMLTDQVFALMSWCQGFLYGIGSACPDLTWTNDANEILRDISEITRLDAAAEGEEDEAAFAEITEYVKSAVLLLREELRPNLNRVVH